MADQALLARVLKSQKDVFWQDNASLSEDERQRQWAIQTADLASLLTANVPPPLHSSIEDQTASKAALPKPVSKPRRRRNSVCLGTHGNRSQTDTACSKLLFLKGPSQMILHPRMSRCGGNARVRRSMGRRRTHSSSTLTDQRHRWCLSSGRATPAMSLTMVLLLLLLTRQSSRSEI